MTEQTQAGEQERDVLLEAVATLEDWIGRLPEHSPWHEGFTEIRREVERSAARHEQRDEHQQSQPHAA